MVRHYIGDVYLNINKASIDVILNSIQCKHNHNSKTSGNNNVSKPRELHFSDDTVHDSNTINYYENILEVFLNTTRRFDLYSRNTLTGRVDS